MTIFIHAVNVSTQLKKYKLSEKIWMDQMYATTRRAARILHGKGPILSPSAKTGFGGVTPDKFWKTYMRFGA